MALITLFGEYPVLYPKADDYFACFNSFYHFVKLLLSHHGGRLYPRDITYSNCRRVHRAEEDWALDSYLRFPLVTSF